MAQHVCTIDCRPISALPCIAVVGPTLTRKGATYTECLVPACRYIHLVVDGRAWAEWTHPRVKVGA